MNNGKVKIDKGIPIPSSHAKHSVYPWGELKVGESFIVPRTQSAGWANMRYAPKKFITRNVEGGKRRVWRVE